jgi:hypothetical protein
MKFYTFKRESNNFDDLLNDSSIKSAIKTKIIWVNHVMLGFSEDSKNENLFGYIVLKYGEYIVNLTEKDYTPKPNIDYFPIRKQV